MHLLGSGRLAAHGTTKLFVGRLGKGGYKEYDNVYIPYIPPSPEPETKARAKGTGRAKTMARARA